MNKDKINVAIIGAGQTGASLIKHLCGMPFIGVLMVADVNDKAPGIIAAKVNGIPVTTDFMDIARLGKTVDLIIEVSGAKDIKSNLRKHMIDTENFHTVIVPELVAIMLLSMASGRLVDSGHDYKGYA